MRLPGTTVLFFAGPLYEDLELWYPKIRLEEEGARTVVAGTGERTYQGKRGYPLTVDADVEDLQRRRLRRPGHPRRLRARHHAPVEEAAPAHPRDLRGRQAGRLHLPRRLGADLRRDRAQDKRGTSVGAIKDDLVNAGMVWEDSPVVVDGNLISSRTPADLPQFMRALIRALEAGRPALAEPVAGAR